MRLIELLIEEPRGPTRLAQAANLNYLKCEECLRQLSASGFVVGEMRDGHDTYSATLKGKTVFMNWAKIYEELNLS
jgi:predicted transcriptional regulator